jgi:5-methylcytosine-specific restriction endonuclease McrA
MIISATLRRQVIERAGNRCEYCGLAQAGQEAAFHIDHVVPAIVGGNTSLENLALACVSCSLRKGARQLVQGPHTREQVALFTEDGLFVASDGMFSGR